MANNMSYELYHHGILGMHWGVRRFQNPDGSLTAKGRQRYQEGSSFGSKGRRVRAMDAARYKDESKKFNAKDMEIFKKVYQGLVKDLDPREIEYGELVIQDYKRTQAGGLAGGLVGIAGSYAVTPNITKRLNELRKEFKNGK